MTKEVEDEDEAEVEDKAEVEVEAVGVAKDEEKVTDKLKMKKEVPTTLHVVEDTMVEEAAERIGTISIVIIMANMVIT
jgi:DNA-directed RNA polymerase specialized sigma24 family protein